MNESEIVNYLDDVQLDRYLKFQPLFESDGWKLVEEWAEGQATVAALTGANASSWDENRVAYGRRQAWEDIKNMANQFMNEFLAVAESNKEEADATDEVE